MKARSILVILMVALGMFFFFKKSPQETAKTEEETIESEQVTRIHSEKKSENPTQNQPEASVAVQDNPAAPVVSNEQLEEIQKNFSNQMRQLGQCLSVQIMVDQDKVDPQYDALAHGLSSAFGNMLVKMDDWTQWEGQAADGSIRRIRTEIEYLENNVPTKRLQLYKLNQQGMPELQPLSEDLATNPPDEYIANLRADAQTRIDEKATRGYYTEGEELVVIERNGKVQSFSMTKGEKTFSCTDTNSISSNCQCL